MVAADETRKGVVRLRYVCGCGSSDFRGKYTDDAYECIRCGRSLSGPECDAMRLLPDPEGADGERLANARDALNAIACWADGPEVKGHFDEPGSASMARDCLAEIGGAKP